MNEEVEIEVRNAGYQDGVAWKTDTATKGQLARLRRFHSDRPDFEAWCAKEEEHGRQPATSLATTIDPNLMNRPRSFNPVEDFWNEVGGDDIDIDDVDYLQGFVEGALS